MNTMYVRKLIKNKKPLNNLFFKKNPSSLVLLQFNSFYSDDAQSMVV